MAKCSNCGRSGLFLRLENGLCKNCVKTTPKHEPAKSSLLPILKPRNITVELMPLEHKLDRTRFFNHFDFMVCTLVNARVRVDSKAGVPLGYLPADISDLCLSGHVKSVFFNGRDCEAVMSSVGTGSILVDIFLVPSGGITPAPPPDPLDIERGTKYIYPKVVDDCSIAYWYPSVPVTVMNRDKLREMVVAKLSYESVYASVELTADGNIALSSDGIIIAYLLDRQQMCQDWLNKQLPLRCCFSSFKKGEETVALAFYRDDRRKYSDCKTVVVKLTAYKDEDTQFTVSEMKGLERLKVDEFEGLVLDIYSSEIGKLPAKYRRICEDDSIEAVYFDHFDILEDDEGEKVYVPYVKIYFE